MIASFYIQFDDGIGLKGFLKLLEWTFAILTYSFLGNRVSYCMVSYCKTFIFSKKIEHRICIMYIFMTLNVKLTGSLSVFSSFYVMAAFFVFSILNLAYPPYPNVTWYYELISLTCASFYLMIVFLELKRLAVYSEFVTCLPEYFHKYYFTYTHHLFAKFYYENKWEEWYGNKKKWNKRKPGHPTKA